jgi:hypothetical protein
MSKLKAINAYQLTTNTEDSDVYIHNDEFGCGGDLVECYLKSEADKVIAELKADYKEACDRLQTANIIKDEQLAATRHQKYKRCLAMAEWCNSEMGRETFACFRPRHTKEVWREEHKYWAKWRKIWFELYIKFKEAK